MNFKNDLLRSLCKFCTRFNTDYFYICCWSHRELFYFIKLQIAWGFKRSFCVSTTAGFASVSKKNPSINLASGAGFGTVLQRKGHPVPTRTLRRQTRSTGELSGCRQWCAFLKPGLIGRTKCQYPIYFFPPSSFSWDVSLFFSIEAGRVRAGSCARSEWRLEQAVHTAKHFIVCFHPPFSFSHIKYIFGAFKAQQWALKAELLTKGQGAESPTGFLRPVQVQSCLYSYTYIAFGLQCNS